MTKRHYLDILFWDPQCREKNRTAVEFCWIFHSNLALFAEISLSLIVISIYYVLFNAGWRQYFASVRSGRIEYVRHIIFSPSKCESAADARRIMEVSWKRDRIGNERRGFVKAALAASRTVARDTKKWKLSWKFASSLQAGILRGSSSCPRTRVMHFKQRHLHGSSKEMYALLPRSGTKLSLDDNNGDVTASN